MSEHLCDFLIVGGGAAGCIVARRLAENTSFRVILIEAGRSDENDLAAMDLSRLEEQDETYDWNFLAQTISGAAAPIEYARARMLGGCANHNDCAFIPPTPTDLIAWSRAGGELWNQTHLDASLARIEDKIHIEEAPQGNALSRAFIDAALDLGLPERNFREGVAEGAGWFPLNARGSLRQSSSICYLHPLDALPKNLEVWTDTNVTRLKLDGHRIKGAETSRGSVTVAREVILCAGSINTPQLMMVSGLGPGNHLKEFGIDVHADLPGVGQNLMDHVAANLVFETHDPPPSWERTPCESTILTKLDPAEADPDILFHFVLRLREKYVGRDQFADVPYGVKLSPNVARPRSRGHVQLSGPTIDASPVIELNYFSDNEGYDRRTLIGGLRFARRLAETQSLSPFLKREISPGIDVTNDDDLFSYIRETCETVYHPAGTCRMGDLRNAETVVGPDLAVKGLTGLRIADASVFPDMVTVNICNTVMMVAERAAEIIKEAYSN